jgi:hypothetical protein
MLLQLLSLLINYIPLSISYQEESPPSLLSASDSSRKPACYTGKLCYLFTRAAVSISRVTQILMFFYLTSLYVFFHSEVRLLQSITKAYSIENMTYT